LFVYSFTAVLGNLGLGLGLRLTLGSNAVDERMEASYEDVDVYSIECSFCAV